MNFECYSFFRLYEVVVGLSIRKQTCCLYVLCYSSPIPCQGPNSNLHNLRKSSPGKHNDHANSETEYSFSFHLEKSSWKVYLAMICLKRKKFIVKNIYSMPKKKHTKMIQHGVDEFSLFFSEFFLLCCKRCHSWTKSNVSLKLKNFQEIKIRFLLKK